MTVFYRWAMQLIENNNEWTVAPKNSLIEYFCGKRFNIIQIEHTYSPPYLRFRLWDYIFEDFCKYIKGNLTATDITEYYRVVIETAPNFANDDMPYFLFFKLYSNGKYDIDEACSSFWDRYKTPYLQKSLMIVYDYAFCNNHERQQEIADFFKENLNDIYELWDVPDMSDNSYIHWSFDDRAKYSKLCAKYSVITNVLRLTKSDYAQMLETVNAFNEYIKEHLGDIIEYLVECKEYDEPLTYEDEHEKDEEEL